MADRSKKRNTRKKNLPVTPDVAVQESQSTLKDHVTSLVLLSSESCPTSSPKPSFMIGLSPSPLQLIRESLIKGKAEPSQISRKAQKKMNVFELDSDDESPLAGTTKKQPGKARRGKKPAAVAASRGKSAPKEDSKTAKKRSPSKKGEEKENETSPRGKKSVSSPRKSPKAGKQVVAISPKSSTKSKSPSKQTSRQQQSRSRQNTGLKKAKQKDSHVSPPAKRGSSRKRNETKAAQEIESNEPTSQEDEKEDEEKVVAVKKYGRKRQAASTVAANGSKSETSSTSRSKRARITTMTEDSQRLSDEEKAEGEEKEVQCESKESTQESHIDSSGQEKATVFSRRRGARNRGTSAAKPVAAKKTTAARGGRRGAATAKGQAKKGNNLQNPQPQNQGDGSEAVNCADESSPESGDSFTQGGSGGEVANTESDSTEGVSANLSFPSDSCSPGLVDEKVCEERGKLQNSQQPEDSAALQGGTAHDRGEQGELDLQRREGSSGLSPCSDFEEIMDTDAIMTVKDEETAKEDPNEQEETEQEEEENLQTLNSKRRKIAFPIDVQQTQQQQLDGSRCDESEMDTGPKSSSSELLSQQTQSQQQQQQQTTTATAKLVSDIPVPSQSLKDSVLLAHCKPTTILSIASSSSTTATACSLGTVSTFSASTGQHASSPRKDVKSLSSLTRKNPSLIKTSSWPKTQQKMSSPMKKVTTTKTQGPLAQSTTSSTVAKKPESKQEKGEKQMFFEEIYYLLDNFVPTQSSSIRSFSIVNMATNCLKPEFRKKLNTFRLAPRIMNCLQDAASNALLRLSTSFLLFMFTREYSLPLFFDKKCFELMANILEAEVEKETNSESASAVRVSKEYGMLEKKVRFCLEQWSREQYITTSGKSPSHQISSDLISPGDLIIECVIALTNPKRKQHFKNVLRQFGVLDPIGRRVMYLVRRIESCPPSDVISEELEVLLKRLEQSLLVLEQAILNCYDNQCYLIVFEGSALICSLSKLLRALLELVVTNGERQSSGDDNEQLRGSNCSVNCLVTLLKLLSSLTHDNDMACIRLGENVGIMDQVVKCSLQAPHCVAVEDKFNVTILGLSVLINLTEHSPSERAVFTKQWYLCQRREDRGRVVLEHIALLFCKHFSAADSVDINLPNMVEQTNTDEAKVTSGFESRGPSGTEFESEHTGTEAETKSFNPSDVSQQQQKQQQQTESAKTELNFDDSYEYVSDEEEEDSFEHEKSVADLSTSLVINREEFNQALEQAGQQLEDSLVAFYCALLLGTLSRHDRAHADVVKCSMPSKSFSEMVKILDNFLSFLDYAKLGSKSSTDSVREIIHFLSDGEQDGRAAPPKEGL